MVSIQESPEEKVIDFLKSVKDEHGEYKYRKKLSLIALTGQRSMIIDFEDLIVFDPDLSRRVVADPDLFFDPLHKAVMTQMAMEDPEYAEQVGKIFVRFRRLPDKLSLRKIGAENLNRLVLIDGIVVRSTPVKPTIIKAAFQCRSCNETIVIEQKGQLMRGVSLCPHCRGKYLDLDIKSSVFMNSQDLRIQERPEDLPPGQLPRAIDVSTNEDLVDVARPGDRVSVTGVLRALQEVSGRGARLRTFDLLLEANYIDIPSREAEVIEISPEEEEQIKTLAKDPWINRKLIQSLAPSIYGYQQIKEAILYLLFGGVQKRMPDGVTIRGDVNVLLVGDPGTAKSALLQYTSRIAPRGLYTSGRGSTAAGLTAAVLREKTGGMVLEAGALVLADKGVASIDEIDKMRPEDRVAIHEAMEQQTVSVAKGGIVATLNARASILAAANPALGRYDPYKLIAENINLPVTILSRFDLIFLMKDIPDHERDAKTSDHILELHKVRRSPEEPPISLELLRKYIAYGKRIETVLMEETIQRLKEFYLKMRDQSVTTPGSPIAITPRQLEALVRLSEARAKTFLRDKVLPEDAKAVITLMTLSLQDVGMDTTTGKIDIDVIMTGKSKSLRDMMQLVRTTLTDLEGETGVVEETKLYEELQKIGLKDEDFKKALTQLLKEGLIYSPKSGYLKRTTI